MGKENSPILEMSERSASVELTTIARGGLRLAIPTRGELAKGSMEYLSLFGWNVTPLAPETEKLSANLTPTFKVFKQRADDAVTTLREGAIDMAILGADVIAEAKLDQNDPADLIALNPLGFGGCDFRMAFPVEKPIPTEKEVFSRLDNGGRIATSLPNLLTAILKMRNYTLNRSQLVTFTGGVELGVQIYDDVFAVADRVSSGDTMVANSLKDTWALWRSSGAYLVTNRKFYKQRIWQAPESKYWSFS